MALIPATILTGFLGSGKTTLLKRILTEAHGQKIAVIENEFGEENIDNDILVADTKEQIVQMSNGCICCTIREDLRTALAELAAKRRKGELQFDRVVIETTGLADPGPVAQTFFMDDEIAETYLLDSILTLVDAKHCDHPHHHHHDDDVKSFVFRSDRPFNPAKLEDFLGTIVQIYGPRMLRYKGVLYMQGTDRKVVFQGVHQLMGSDLGPKWAEGEPKVSKMVFIGIDLPKDIFTQGLQQCLA